MLRYISCELQIFFGHYNWNFLGTRAAEIERLLLEEKNDIISFDVKAVGRVPK